MNATTHTAPPPPTDDQQTGEGGPIIALKTAIIIPNGIFLAGNILGTHLLFQILQRELANHGLLDESPKPVAAGEFNDAWYVFAVNTTGAALAVVEEILVSLNIRGVCTLLYFDHREKFFRPHGEDHACIGPGFTLDRLREQADRDCSTLKSIENKGLETMALLKRFIQNTPPDAPGATPP